MNFHVQITSFLVAAFVSLPCLSGQLTQEWLLKGLPQAMPDCEGTLALKEKSGEFSAGQAVEIDHDLVAFPQSLAERLQGNLKVYAEIKASILELEFELTNQLRSKNALFRAIDPSNNYKQTTIYNHPYPLRLMVCDTATRSLAKILESRWPDQNWVVVRSGSSFIRLKNGEEYFHVYLVSPNFFGPNFDLVIDPTFGQFVSPEVSESFEYGKILMGSSNRIEEWLAEGFGTSWAHSYISFVPITD